MKVDRSTVQFVKYCMVGALNTLVTLCTIFVCKSLFDVNEYLSNAIGCGVYTVCNYAYNRLITFR